MSEPTTPTRLPRPVVAAVAILAVQGVVLLAYAGWLVVRRTSETPSNQAVFEGSAVYLALSGLLVLLVAMALRSLKAWALAAGLVVQLIALGVTYEMLRAEFWAGAVLLGAAAVATVGALLARSSRHALGRA